MAIRDITKYTRPKYIESPYSVDTYVGILKTPTLSIDTNNKLRLSWTNIDSNTQLYDLEYSYNSGSWEIYDNPISTATTYDLPDNLSDGTYKFRIRATATIIDSNFHSHDFYSAWSNETAQFTVKTLKKCTIESVNGNSQYYIGNIDTDADYYILTITKDNVSSNKIQFDKNKIPTSNNPYNLDYYEAGTYVLTAIAYNNNEYLFHNATSSNTQTYSVVKLEIPVLRDDKFNKDNPQVDWDPITNANGYSIYLNNIEINPSYAGTTYNFKDDLTPDVLNYSTKIKAVRSGQIKYANPKYLNSEFSNEIKFGTLPNPILGLSSKPGQDNIIEILNKDKFINAEEFEVYDIKQGKETLIIRIPSSESKYVLESSVPKTFNIRMKAISSSKNIINSGFSNLITYSFIKLDSPKNFDISGYKGESATLSWNKVINADFYDLYINDELIQSKIVGTSYTINLPTGSNIIYLIARSKFIRYLDSDRSNSIRNIQYSNNQYTITINNQDYDMILPFTFNETLDESMDTAIAITTPINRKEPFEAGSNVIVRLNEKIATEGEDESVQYKDQPGFPKYMLVSQDDVKEIQIGTKSKYQHNLNLIERTKLLESELMPDFSITQPMEYSKKVNEIKPTAILSDFGGNYILGPTTKIFTKKENPFPWTKPTWYYIFGLNSEKINGELESIYPIGSVIPLPYETSKDFNVLAHQIGIGLAGNVITDTTYNSLTDKNVQLKRVYKYRIHNTDYNTVGEEHVITTVYNNEQVMWNTKNIPIGDYDIILEIEIDDSSWNIIKKAAHYTGKGKMNFMYDQKIANEEELSLDKLHKFRIVWGNKQDGITITNLTDTTPTNKIPWKHKTVWDSINKAVNILNPTTSKKKARYKIDPAMKFLNQIPSPELKFQNGKSLYEVLTIFGRLFYGIPRLGCYDKNNTYQKNWITFDILDSSNIISNINPNFIDKNNIETMVSSIENHNTGYISNITNMITNDYYSEFPSGNLWISARSGAEADVLSNKDNMAIVLDRPIYRLVSVLVKNYDKTNPGSEVDIKDFVDEETIFQSLNNDAEGKGLSIYYKQGDNKILGLGNIPQASESQAAWNIDPTEYIIQRIIRVKTGLGFSKQNNPHHFLYKIIYVPYVDARVFTEQTNIAGLEHPIYKNLNQDNNVIFDQYFGKSAQTQIERLGNNSIKKNYKEINLIKLPKLGQIKEFDGYNYYADEITYTFNNNYIDCEVNFSKNFNKINERIGIDAEYRLFKIYADEYINRSINVNEYCYVSTNKYSTDIPTISHTNYNLINNFIKSFNNGSNKCEPTNKPDSFYIRNFKPDLTRLEYQDYKGESKYVPCSLIGASYNTFANSILFSGSFIDNYSSGVRVSTPQNAELAKTGQKVQQDVRYVDNNGENPLMGITLFNLDTNSVQVSSDSYPEASYIETPNTLNNALFSERINLDKDNKECINLAYQLHFQTFDKDITIHKALISHLYKDKNKTSFIEESPKYILFKGDVSKQDKILKYTQQTDFIQISRIDNSAVIKSINITPNDDYDGYALLYSTGDIAISVKKQIKKGSSFTIPTLYFNFSDNKINYQPK